MDETAAAGGDAPRPWSPLEGNPAPAPGAGPPPAPGQAPPPAPGWSNAPPPPPPPPWGQPQWGQPQWGQPPGWGWPPPPPQPKGGSARTGPLPLHPMTIGDLLDGAFKLLKANILTIAVVAGVFIVPVQVVAAFIQRNSVLAGASVISAFDDPEAVASSSDDGTAALVAMILFVGAGLLLFPFVHAAVARVVASSYLGEEMPPGPALRIAARRWPAVFAGQLLAFLLTCIGFVLVALVIVVAATANIGAAAAVLAVLVFLLSIPLALAVGTLLVATVPAIVVEGLGPLRGIARSVRLIRRRFWGALGATLLVLMLTYFVATALAVPFSVAAVVIGTGRGGWILQGVGESLRYIVVLPLWAIFTTLLYFDGRIRSEGFDLQVVAGALAASDR